MRSHRRCLNTPERRSAPVAPRLLTRAEDMARRAAAALVQARERLAQGDAVTARRWLERAVRLAPEDAAAALALGNLLLGQGDPGAVAHLARAARASDAREAWLGLALAAHAAGRDGEARDAIAALLSRHVLPVPLDPVRRVAGLILAREGLPGWCGIVAVEAAPRRLRLVVEGAQATVRVDGARLRGRDVPASGTRLDAERDGVPLLGSPIDLTRLRRLDGVVATHRGGLEGWAWHPADPDADPALSVSDGAGRCIAVRATRPEAASTALARPRRFAVPAAALRDLRGPLRVRGPDGADLPGSPLDPHARPRAVPVGPIASPASAPSAPRRGVAVVVPVHGARDATFACLDSLRRAGPSSLVVIVVDDASPDPDLQADLDAMAAEGQIVLLRNAMAEGYPRAANRGLRAALALRPVRDVILLNSDTLLPAGPGAGWVARLRASVHAASDIGTATPLSNDATIMSYPQRDGRNPMPDAQALATRDRLAARTLAGQAIEVPTAHGFCMYLRHECAADVGAFRAELFAQGYGEENDFCLRARARGWRHVAVPSVMVGHRGGASFGTARAGLLARNLDLLERLHPGYHHLIAAHRARHPALDPLAPSRRALDLARWRATSPLPAIAFVTHDQGGGVARALTTRIAALRQAGQRAILLRPVLDPEGTDHLPGLCRVDDGTEAFPNLVWHLPHELDALAEFLRASGVTRIEWHHRLGHDPALARLPARLGVPVSFHQHDYAAICPRVTLTDGAGRYCGEPDLAACEACLAREGDRTGEGLSVAALRARSAAEFASAERVVVPHADMARRLQRHFPALRADTAPLEPDDMPPPPAPPAGLPRRVAVIGAIGREKGFDVLLACAEEAAASRLPLEFVLIGHGIDDDALFATGRVFVTGPFAEGEGEALVRAQRCHLAFLPSLWPETWGFTLGLAWRAGLPAAVFDIGAMAARTRASGHGWVLPLGLPPAMINRFLLAPPRRLGEGAAN